MLRPPISADANRFVAAALDRVDGYDAALRLAAEAQRKLDELTPVPDVAEKLDPVNGGKITDEWLSATIKHSAALAERDAHCRILTDLRRRAEDKAGSIVHASLDNILAGLHGELTKLMSEVDDVAGQLGGATSALEAVSQDVAPQWKRLSELAVDYSELRRGQQLLMVRFDATRLHAAKRADGSGDDHCTDLCLSNLDNIWPDWRTPSPSVFHVDGSRDRLEPWPEGDGAELLLWLVTSPAKAWIPTRQQLDQLWRDRQRRANPNPKIIAGSTTLLNEALPAGRRIAPTIVNLPSAESVLT